MFLFYAIKTTGFPKNWEEHWGKIDIEPRLVQFVWIVYNQYRNVLESKKYIVLPIDFEIPNETIKIEDTDNEIANYKGTPIKSILNEFLKDLGKVKYVIAHDLEFYEKVILSELNNNNIKGYYSVVNRLIKICIKTSTKIFVNKGNYPNYLWPKLSDLSEKLFGNRFTENNNALYEAKIVAKCFWELWDRNVLSVYNKNTKKLCDQCFKIIRKDDQYCITCGKQNIEAYLRDDPGVFLNIIIKRFPIDLEIFKKLGRTNLSEIINELDFELIKIKNKLSNNHILSVYINTGCFDWANISEHSPMPINLELLQRFENNWKWYILSQNTSLSWDINLVEKFKDKWDWYYLGVRQIALSC